MRYVGVIGAVQFDKNGDIVGPFRTWRITNGEVVTVGQMSMEDVMAVQAKSAEVKADPRAHAARAGPGDFAPRHRPVAGGRHGARRPHARPDSAARRRWPTMRRPASTPSTWPTTTARPKSSPARCWRAHRRPRAASRAFTKWCPPPGPMTAAVVREGVQRALDRLRVERIDLMQFHWWSFEHPAYLDAMAELARLRDEGLIAHLGLTNFDTEHLRAAAEARHPDRQQSGLRSRCWTAVPPGRCRVVPASAASGCWPTARWAAASSASAGWARPEPAEVADWSKMKYRRFIDADRRLGGVASAAAALRRHCRASTACRCPTWPRAGCCSSRRWRR